MIGVTVDGAAWMRNFKTATKKSEKQAKTAFRKAAKGLYNKIVSYTPVGDPSLWKWPAHADYVPGKLKESWTIEESTSEIIIKNDQPYAYRIEYGSWSTQAPYGMMRRAVFSFPSLLRAATINNGDD